jgi:hypothetical protein
MCIEYDLARGKQPTKKELRKYVADIKSANRSIREYLRSLFQREEEEDSKGISPSRDGKEESKPTEERKEGVTIRKIQIIKKQ